jgi:hypothetical protein
MKNQVDVLRGYYKNESIAHVLNSSLAWLLKENNFSTNRRRPKKPCKHVKASYSRPQG